MNEKSHKFDFFRRYPLVFPALTSCLAVVTSEYTQLWGFVLLLVSILVGLLWVGRGMFILALLLGFLLYSSHGYKIQRYSKDQSSIENKERVSLNVKLLEKLSTNRFVVEVVGDSEWRGKRFLYSNFEQPKIGEIHTGSFQMKSPMKPLNPGSFDAVSWLKRKNVLGSLVGKGEKKECAQIGSITQFLETSKLYVKSKLEYGIENKENVQVIHSMFLGEKQSASTSVINNFRFAGVMHVFAVSGLHVMIVGGIGMLLLKLIGLPRSWSVLVAVGLMFLYAGITGWQISATRAAVMATVLLSGWIFKRQPCMLSSLSLAAIIVCFWDSHQVFSPGFQLSFGVVLSIFILLKPISKLTLRYTELDPFLPPSLYSFRQVCTTKAKQYTGSGVAVTIAAWIGAAPLVAYYFKMVSFIGILISVPVVVVLTCVLWLGILSVALGSIWQPLAYPLNQLNAGLVSNMSGMVHHAANLPGGHVRFDKKRGESVEIFSVGGGAANYLNIGGGVVFDTGYKGDSYKIKKALQSYQRGVDSMILSHADSSHIGGAIALLNDFNIQQILCSETKNSSSVLKEIVKAAERSGTALITATDGALYPISNDAAIEVILNGSFHHGSTADDRGLIVRLRWGDTKILFMNDAGYFIEQTLLQNGYNLDADVLVIGQHVDQSGVSPQFIRAVSPHSIIASNGVAYFEGQRDFGWLNMVKEEGVKLYLLPDTGYISIEKKGESLKINTPLR